MKQVLSYLFCTLPSFGIGRTSLFSDLIVEHVGKHTPLSFYLSRQCSLKTHKITISSTQINTFLTKRKMLDQFRLYTQMI